MSTFQSALNPARGQIIPGVKVNDHQFVAALQTAQLFQIVADPRLTEEPRAVEKDPQLAATRDVRMDVQRAFAGAKARNVPSYANYICQLAEDRPGLAPSIILWSQDRLDDEERDDGSAVIQVPFTAQLVAIDGETQLAARFEAASAKPATRGSKVSIIFCHGRPKEWARQAFHDVNTFGVKPNAALAIGMDARDPLTSVARDVETAVPFFKGRVNTSSRQLGRTDTRDVVTITALRGACVTFAEGIGGIKHGARPLIIPLERVDAVRAGAIAWFRAVTEFLGTAMEDREHKVAAAAPVLAAIGALGHGLLLIDDPVARENTIRTLIEGLRDVRWEKGQHWVGIAGKMNASQKFSIGGTKEVAYQVFNALSDKNYSAYQVIRGGEAQAAAAV